MNTSPNPILLLASGQRTGSTLLQRFITSHPDILIWGEHDGVLTDIFKRYDRLYFWEEMFAHQLVTYQRSGYNNFIPNMIPSAEVIRSSQRAMLETLYHDPARALGKSIWGFKEVLYDADMAVRLRTLFPDLRVIYMTRHPFHAFVSLLHEERLKPAEINIPLSDIWTREKTIAWVQVWIDINRSFLEHPAIDNSWVFSLTYEQLVADIPATTGHMIDWLGLKHDDFDLGVFNHRIYTDRDNEQSVRRDTRSKIHWEDLTAEEFRLMTQPELLRIATQLGYDMPVNLQQVAPVSKED